MTTESELRRENLQLREEKSMLELRQENRELKRQVERLKKGKPSEKPEFIGSFWFYVAITSWWILCIVGTMYGLAN